MPMVIPGLLRVAAVLAIFWCTPVWAKDEVAHQLVSLTKVIIDPMKYVGSRVEILGWLSSWSSFSVFLTEEHAKAMDIDSAVKVAIEDDRPLEPAVA
jgi:hypothetical protein